MISYWVFAIGVVLALFLVSLRRSKGAIPFPPGPKGYPIVKNMFDMPKAHEHLIYSQWGRQYGDVTHVTALGKHIIILNSIKAATELLDQRSAIYSDRPYLHMLLDPDLMNGGWGFSVVPYSRRWKRHRRLFTQHLSHPTTFANKQTSVTFKLLNAMLESRSGDFGPLISQAMTSIILGVAYGREIRSMNDPLVVLNAKAMVLHLEGIKPKYIVNSFPAAKHIPTWFPGNSFKPLAKAASQTSKRLIEEPYMDAVQRMHSGDSTPSFVQTAVLNLPEKGDPEAIQDIKEVATQMYAAGVHTTGAALHFLLLQLVLNPALQYRAQAELDAIVDSPDTSTFRFPTLADRPAVPYIDAMLKEIFRFMPPVPTGVPHAVLEEDEYRGWRIPKGAFVIFNSWEINRDEKTYSEPHRFNPDRFIKDSSKLPEPDPVASFGFGRRVCPGRVLAESTLWLQVACMLAAFNILPAKDANGNDIDVHYAEEPISGFVMNPPAFPCTIVPRSERIVKLIREVMLQGL